MAAVCSKQAKQANKIKEKPEESYKTEDLKNIHAVFVFVCDKI